jgi:hypothetical protein
MPYAGHFPGAASYGSLPTLSCVVPNQLHDMHDGTIAQGDSWLLANLGAYATWCVAHNSLLIVTFDENDGSSGNHVATIFFGASVVPGRYSQTVDHYDVLRTLEDTYGLPHDAGSTTATTITNIWAPTGSQTWTDLGYGLAGSAGTPALTGTGTLVTGTAGTLSLSHAAPSSFCTLVVSYGGLTTPFKCGTLVPVPVAFQLPMVTSGSGAITTVWPRWPAGFSGLSLYFQFVVRDAGAVCGMALSNAVRADVP